MSKYPNGFADWLVSLNRSVLKACTLMDKYKEHLNDFYRSVDAFVFGIAIEEEWQVWDEYDTFDGETGKPKKIVRMSTAFEQYLKDNGTISWFDDPQNGAYCLMFSWKGVPEYCIKIPYYSLRVPK